MMTRKDFLNYKKYYEKGDKYLKKQAIEYFTKNLKSRIESLKEYKKYLSKHPDDIVVREVVKNLQEAVEHINKYGSKHSDAIITRNKKEAEEFFRSVDSACLYVNASTRFTDGYEFGFGAEIGISTDKLHARGPMALLELTTYKYIVFGKGQIRQ